MAQHGNHGQSLYYRSTSSLSLLQVIPCVVMLISALLMGMGSSQDFETRVYYNSQTGEETHFVSLASNLPQDKLSQYRQINQDSIKHSTIPLYQWDKDVDFTKVYATQLTPKHPAVFRNTTIHATNLFYTPPSYTLQVQSQAQPGSHPIPSPTQADIPPSPAYNGMSSHNYTHYNDVYSPLTAIALPPTIHSVSFPSTNHLQYQTLLDLNTTIPEVSVHPSTALHPPWDFSAPYNAVASLDVRGVWDYLAGGSLDNSSATQQPPLSHSRFTSTYFTSPLSPSMPTPSVHHPHTTGDGRDANLSAGSTPHYQTQIEHLLHRINSFAAEMHYNQTITHAPSNIDPFQPSLDSSSDGSHHMDPSSPFLPSRDQGSMDTHPTSLHPVDPIIDHIIPPSDPATGQINLSSPFLQDSPYPSTVKTRGGITIPTGFHPTPHAVTHVQARDVFHHLLQRDPSIARHVLQEMVYDIDHGLYDAVIKQCQVLSSSPSPSSQDSMDTNSNHHYYGYSATSASNIKDVTSPTPPSATCKGIEGASRSNPTDTQLRQPVLMKPLRDQLANNILDFFSFPSPSQHPQPPSNAHYHPALWLDAQYINDYILYYQLGEPPLHQHQPEQEGNTILRVVPLPTTNIPYSLNRGLPHAPLQGQPSHHTNNTSHAVHPNLPESNATVSKSMLATDAPPSPSPPQSPSPSSSIFSRSGQTLSVHDRISHIFPQSFTNSAFSFDKVNAQRRQTSIIDMFRDGNTLYRDRSGLGYVCEQLSDPTRPTTQFTATINASGQSSVALHATATHQHLIQSHGLSRAVILPPRAAKKLHLYSSHHPLHGNAQGAWDRIFHHYFEYSHLFLSCNVELEVVKALINRVSITQIQQQQQQQQQPSSSQQPSGGDHPITTNSTRHLHDPLPASYTNIVKSVYDRFYPSSASLSPSPGGPTSSTPALPSLSSFIHIQFITTRYIQHNSREVDALMACIQFTAVLRTTPPFTASRQHINASAASRQGKRMTWVIPTLIHDDSPYSYESYESFFHFISSCPNVRQSVPSYSMDEHTDLLRSHFDDTILDITGPQRAANRTSDTSTSHHSGHPAHPRRKTTRVYSSISPYPHSEHGNASPGRHQRQHHRSLSTKYGYSFHTTPRQLPTMGDLTELVALHSTTSRLFSSSKPSAEHGDETIEVCIDSAAGTGLNVLVEAQLPLIVDYFNLMDDRHDASPLPQSKLSGLRSVHAALLSHIQTTLCPRPSSKTQHRQQAPIYIPLDRFYQLYYFIPSAPMFSQFTPHQIHAYNIDLLRSSYDIATLPLPLNSLLFNFTQFHRVFPQPLVYAAPYSVSDLDALVRHRSTRFTHSNSDREVNNNEVTGLASDRDGQYPIKLSSRISVDLIQDANTRGAASSSNPHQKNRKKRHHQRKDGQEHLDDASRYRIPSTYISNRILRFFTDITPMVVDITPGDVLAIPPFFFHQYHSLTPSLRLTVTCAHKEYELTSNIHNQLPSLDPNNPNPRDHDKRALPSPQVIPMTLLWINSLSHSYTNGAGQFIGEMIYSRYTSQLHLFYNMNPFCPLSYTHTSMQLLEMPHIINMLTQYPVPPVSPHLPRAKKDLRKSRNGSKSDLYVDESVISPYSLYHHSPCELLLYKPRIDEMSLYLLHQAARRIMTPPEQRDDITITDILSSHAYSFRPLHLIRDVSPFTRLCFELDNPTMALATVCGQGLKGLSVPEVRKSWDAMKVDQQLSSFLSYVATFQEQSTEGSMTRVEKETLLFDHIENILLHQTNDPLLTQLLFLGCFIDQIYEVHLQHGGRIVPHT